MQQQQSKLRFWCVASKSRFRGLPEVKIQQKISLWKTESQESTSEDITIESYGGFEITQKSSKCSKTHKI